MIAKKYRLREYEVSRVFKKGRPFFWTYWTMNCLEVRNAKNHRMAVSISRKHDKRAVARNRYRRGLYDGMRDILASTKYIERSSLTLDMPEGISPVQSTKIDTPIPTLPQTRNFLCVFTLKKGLKLTEKKIPTVWIEDARKLLQKISPVIMN